mgnify:CR=1 FL=1
MIGELIDTNILTRFFIGDNPEQHKKAEKFFREAELGKRKLRLTALVAAEVVYVLESFYKRQRQEIAEFLEVFISQKWLIVENRKIMQNIWPWYLQGFHFVDSFLLAWGKANNEKILSFDKKLMRTIAR